MSLVILVCLLLASVGSVVLYVRSTRGSNPAAVATRLDRYGVAAAAGTGTSVSQVVSPFRKQRSQQSAVSQAADKLVERGRLSQPIMAKLERADLKWTPGEFLMVCIAAFFIACLVGLLIKGTLGLLALGAVSLVAPWIYLGRRISKRRNKFLGQLADMAQMMGNSMRAGFSIVQSMELVANEGPSPAREEFERVIAEVKLGLPLDRALEHMLSRVPSEELQLAVIAINVQRQVGGNLAEILMVIAKTVRERVRFARDLRALTAQARYSSYIITGLPVAVAVVINIIDRPYESYLYTNPVGHIMIAASVIMLALGFFCLSRIADIEV
jgi:tight adherence protein B